MTYYYFSLLLGLLGFFIGTSSHMIGMDCSNPSQKIRTNQNKRSAFFASDHIIKIQSGEDATTRSNQTTLRMYQKTDQAEALQQNHISHQRNYPSNKQHKGRIMYQILKNKTVICETDDLTTAIKIVQTLESSLIRFTDHSPYTIDKRR